MASKFMSLADGVSDALASFAAAEIGEAEDVDSMGMAVCAWLTDAAYTLRRVAARMDQTALNDYVLSKFHSAAAGQAANSAMTEDELGRPLILRRP